MFGNADPPVYHPGPWVSCGDRLKRVKRGPRLGGFCCLPLAVLTLLVTIQVCAFFMRMSWQTPNIVMGQTVVKEWHRRCNGMLPPVYPSLSSADGLQVHLAYIDTSLCFIPHPQLTG